MICLWVIGVITVNVSGETLGRSYYGSFSEAATVPSSGWMAFDEGSGVITVSHVVPNKMVRFASVSTVYPAGCDVVAWSRGQTAAAEVRWVPRSLG